MFPGGKVLCLVCIHTCIFAVFSRAYIRHSVSKNIFEILCKELAEENFPPRPGDTKSADEAIFHLPHASKNRQEIIPSLSCDVGYVSSPLLLFSLLPLLG